MESKTVGNKKRYYRKKNNSKKNNKLDQLSVKVNGLGNTLKKVLGKGDYYTLEDYRDRPFQTYGSKLGGYAGKYIGNLLGHGDYKVVSNSLLQKVDPGQTPPQFSGMKSTRIRHREYIQDIVSSSSGNPSNFLIQGFPLNPGLLGSFPWLSQVAENYEAYRIHGMLFEYKPLVGNAISSTNNSLGYVVMATQYNANSSPFVNKQQMENYEFAQSSVPSECIYHYIECAKYETPVTELYIRTGSVGSQDLRLYDWGQFFIASGGVQANNIVLGELHVTYDIEFFKPKLIAGGFGDEILYYHALLGTGISTSNYFAGANPTATSNFFLAFTGTTIIFPQNISEGNWTIFYFVRGTSGTVLTPTVTFTSNCQALNLYNGGTQSFAGMGGTSGNLLYQVSFTITGPNPVITFSGGTMPTSITGGDLFVTQINGIAN